MKEKLLSDQIKTGQWYTTSNRPELIQAIEDLILDKQPFEFKNDNQMFRRNEDKPFSDLFDWACGRTDCRVEGGNLFHNDRLIAIRQTNHYQTSHRSAIQPRTDTFNTF